MTFSRLTLRQARQLKGISQKQLAEQISCDPSSVSEWENYKRVMPVDKAIQFAQLTGFRMDDLIFVPDNVEKYA